jgi:DNA-directed RNA polymerase specialized sigma24 family protein
MELPDGVTEEKFLAAYHFVIDKIAHKYVFTSFECDDIRQEAFIIAYDGLKSYDNERSLENFLYIHLSNRLKNFKRDNYYRYEVGDAQKMQDTKKSILEPIDIHELFHIATGSDIEDEAHLTEIHEIIDEKLPANMRSDYLKLKNKGKLTKSRKVKIIKKLQEIIDGEHENEEG